MATRPLLSLHPSEQFVAVACGPTLRIYSSASDGVVEPANILDDAKDSILLVKFDPTGRFLVTSGTDKVVKFWDIATWKCLWSRQVPKRASTAAFTPDGAFVLLADKFGVVTALPSDGSAAAGGADDGDEGSESLPGTLFGHYCSVITDIAVSRACKWVATSDRDNKIRISLLPRRAKMLDGAFEIQTFCLGHTDAVTGISLLPTVLDSDGNEAFLVSGSVDGTVRLWTSLDGELLDTLPLADALGRVDPTGDAPRGGDPIGEASKEGDAGSQEEEDKPEEKGVLGQAGADAIISAISSKSRPPAVMALTATAWHAQGADGSSSGSCIVAVSVEVLPLVLLLAADTNTQRLSRIQAVHLPCTAPPACLEFDRTGQLWALMLAACGPRSGDSSQDSKGKDEGHEQGKEQGMEQGKDTGLGESETGSRKPPGKGKVTGPCELALQVLRQALGGPAGGDAGAMAVVTEEDSAVLRGVRKVLCSAPLAGCAPVTHLSEEIRKKEYPSDEVEGKKRKRADKKLKAGAE